MTEFKKICPVCGNSAKRHIYLGRAFFCSDECKQKWIHNELSKPGVRFGLTTPLFKYVMAECSKRNSDSCFDRCSMCGKLFIPGVDDDREYHHIIPLDIGGNNLPENIVILCRNCHALVHSYPLEYPKFIKPTRFFDNINDFVNWCFGYRDKIRRCSLWIIIPESKPSTINYRIIVRGSYSCNFACVHKSHCNVRDNFMNYSINECKQVFNSFNEIAHSSKNYIPSNVIFTSDVCEVDGDFIGCIDNWINDLNEYSGCGYFAYWSGIIPKFSEGA